MRPRKNLRFMALVLVLALIAGCSSKSPTPSPEPTQKPVVEEGRGGRLVVAVTAGADSLDPAATVTVAASSIFSLINEPLVYRTSTGFGGQLAERWEPSADSKEWTFFLRKGVTFSNGNPFNADAVVFTFNRILDPATKAPSRAFLGALQSVEKVDEYTVKFTMAAPSALLLDGIANSYFGILDPKAVQAAGADYGRNPVGTGPFILKEWVTGDHVTLVPNEKHQSFLPWVKNKNKPLLDELVFREIPQVETQLAAMQSGEVNMVGVPGEKAAQYKGRPGFNLTTVENATSLSYLSFGREPAADGGLAAYRAPLGDQRLRQAIGHAIDTQSIIDKVLYGFATLNRTPMPTGVFGYNPSLAQHSPSYDPAKAKALLEEAGWKVGTDGIREKDGAKLELRFWAIAGGGLVEAAQVIQNQLQQVGIKTTITQLDAATFTAQAKTGDFHMELLNLGWPAPNFLIIMSTIGWGVGAANDTELLTMLAQAETIADDGERREAFGRAQTRILQSNSMLPLWSLTAVTLTRESVKNLAQDPLGQIILNDIYVKE